MSQNKTQTNIGGHITFIRDLWPFNPQHPNAWRGEISLIARAFGRKFRIMYFPAVRLNDCNRVDTMTRFNISPRWFRRFHLSGYGRGKNLIVHLTIGHISLSTIPDNIFTW